MSVASSVRTQGTSRRTARMAVRGAHHLRMTTARRLVIALLALCAGLGVPVGVASADRDAVLQDCQDGRLDQGHSRGDLRDAIEDIPTDLDEYTDCRDVIRRAQLGLNRSSSGGSGSGGSGGGTVGAGSTGGTGGGSGGSGNATEALANATPEEKDALARTAATGGNAPVRIGGALVGPRIGVSSSTSLPTPLVVVLVLLSLAGLAAGGVRVTRLVGARRS